MVILVVMRGEAPKLYRMNPKNTISVAELATLLSKGCQLIDVREPVEFAQERIAGAKLIPLGQLEARFAEVCADQPVVVMCQSGRRGGEAVKKLAMLNVSSVRNLEGGILAWKTAGHPVEKDGRGGLPLMQQVQLTIGLGVLTGAALALTVNPNWVFLCAFLGAGLTFAGSTGWCGLAILLSKMPWNRVGGKSCCASGNCSTNP